MIRRKQGYFFLLQSLSILLALTAIEGCQERTIPASPLVLGGETQGTTYSIKLSELTRQQSVYELQVEIDTVLAQIDTQMSNWNPDSEVSQFNKFSETEWFDVSADTARVVATALDISQQSGGAFDITIKPLVDLWGFGSVKNKSSIPTDREIKAALQHSGWQRIEVRASPPSLRKSSGDVQLDLSGIAQGFTVDRLATLLESKGISSYLIEVGGEMRAHGRKEDGTAWKIGIERPAKGTVASRTVHRIVALNNCSLATSGDYRHYRVLKDKHYSHTIDPRTGRPVEHRLASVSVLTENCMRADALATLLMVLGPEDGFRWAIERKIAAVFIVRDGNGFSERLTPQFIRHTVDEK
jgi:thiamine biosynthesis lipoprotein